MITNGRMKNEKELLEICQSVRFSLELSREIQRVVERTDISKQDVIRLAIRKGLPLVEEFCSAKPTDLKLQESLKKATA